MTSEYFLPAVSRQTTSPLASRSIDGSKATSSGSYTLPQLPSLKSTTRRLSVGSSSGRLPLASIQINNLENIQRTDMDVESNESEKISIDAGTKSSNNSGNSDTVEKNIATLM